MKRCVNIVHETTRRCWTLILLLFCLILLPVIGSEISSSIDGGESSDGLNDDVIGTNNNDDGENKVAVESSFQNEERVHKSESLLLQLTVDNFIKVTSEHNFLLVYFYSPRCPFCRHEDEIKKLQSLSHDLEQDFRIISALLESASTFPSSDLPRIAICNVDQFPGPWNTAGYTESIHDESLFSLSKFLPSLKNVPNFKWIVNNRTIWEYVIDNYDSDDNMAVLQKYIWHYWYRWIVTEDHLLWIPQSSTSLPQIVDAASDSEFMKLPPFFVHSLKSLNENAWMSCPSTVFVLQLRDYSTSTKNNHPHNHLLSLYKQYAQTFEHRLDIGFMATHKFQNETTATTTTNNNNNDNSDITVAQNNHLLVWKTRSEGQPWQLIANYSLDSILRYLSPQNQKRNDTGVQNITEQMSTWIITHTTPPTLWWNTTTDLPRAAWAMSQYYHYCVLLFINNHSNDALTHAQNEHVLQMLENATVELQFHQKKLSPLMTLIVPSTNLRLMMKFGLDDFFQNYCVDEINENGCLLPTMFVMSSRKGFIEYEDNPDLEIFQSFHDQRFHLPSSELLSTFSEQYNSDQESVVSTFLKKIIKATSSNSSDEDKHRIRPYIVRPSSSYHKSLNKDDTSSPHCILSLDICLVSTMNYEEYVLSSKLNHHTLVYFYAPTCGHCKRFYAAIWKVLAQFIKQNKLSSIINLVQMDVTENVIFEGEWFMDNAQINREKKSKNGSFLENVPALLYYPPADSNKMDNRVVDETMKKKMISYALRIEGDDKLGESNVGGVNDPFDILEWMIGFGYFDETDLLEQLLSIDNESSK